jgi:hypothetical protein
MSARSKVARFLMHGRGMNHDQAEQMLQDALDEHARELAEKIRELIGDGLPDASDRVKDMMKFGGLMADLIDPDVQ